MARQVSEHVGKRSSGSDPAGGVVGERAQLSSALARPGGGHVRRWLLLAAGVLSLVLGLVGVVVPVLPTTPFLLLSAACFLRSSARMHRWLLGNRLFGEYLRRYHAGEGMSAASKVVTLALLWTTLALSAYVAVPDRLAWLRLVLAAIGVAVTLHILRIRTRHHRGS